MKNFIYLFLFFLLNITVLFSQDENNTVPVIKTEKGTTEILNSIYAGIQKREPSVEITTKEISKISVDQIFVGRNILLTILSDEGLKSKKESTTFDQYVSLVKETKEVGNFNYLKIEKIYIIKNGEGDKVIVALREGSITPNYLEGCLKNL
jgi:hypothetical protein